MNEKENNSPKFCKKKCEQKENNSLNNPIVYKCSKCGKIIYLRQNNFYSLFPRTPASVIHNILKIWLLGEQNATKIYMAISNNSTIHVSVEQTIRNILIKLRQIIAYFLRDKYELEVFADENKNQKIAIDESLFTHIDKKQIWVIGLINSQTKEFRLIPSFKRDSATIKRIVQKFIK